MEGKVHLTVNELVQGTHVYSMDEEVQQLLKEKYGFTEYYRSDPFSITLISLECIKLLYR